MQNTITEKTVSLVIARWVSPSGGSQKRTPPNDHQGWTVSLRGGGPFKERGPGPKTFKALKVTKNT